MQFTVGGAIWYNTCMTYQTIDFGVMQNVRKGACRHSIVPVRGRAAKAVVAVAALRKGRSVDVHGHGGRERLRHRGHGVLGSERHKNLFRLHTA